MLRRPLAGLAAAALGRAASDGEWWPSGVAEARARGLDRRVGAPARGLGGCVGPCARPALLLAATRPRAPGFPGLLPGAERARGGPRACSQRGVTLRTPLRAPPGAFVGAFLTEIRSRVPVSVLEA